MADGAAARLVAVAQAHDGNREEFKIQNSKFRFRITIKTNKTMKKLLLMAVVAIFSLTSCSTYNNMVKMEESVKSAWSNVETQYQRRADLIPNLVSTVKGYASCCYFG